MASDLLPSFEKAASMVTDSVKASAQLTAQALKDVWSVMDAAAEKPMPSKCMGEVGIRSVQGFGGAVERTAKTALKEE